MNDDDTYYDALGTEPEASRDELRAAYRERISELETARERKGVNEAQLQQNREDVARVRAAWNVLSDPFQRKRYDEQLVGASTNGDGGDDVELVDDEEAERQEVQLTGWRRLMAPPPKPTPKAGAGNGKQPPPRRPVREPTIPLPPGVRIAEPRARGMALLFDFAAVLVIYWVVFALVPGLVNSDYGAKRDNSTTFSNLHDAQDNIDSANKDIASANKAIAKAEANGNNSALKSARSDLKSAQDDKKSAQKDFNDAKKDVDKQFQTQFDLDSASKNPAKAYQKTSDQLANDLQGATYVAFAVALFATLLYLVPATALTGRTLGMRRSKIHVIRVDGTGVTWWGAFARFLVPMTIALLPPLQPLGALLGLGMVLWGYRDPNGQGIHDKLARTLVVADA